LLSCYRNTDDVHGREVVVLIRAGVSEVMAAYVRSSAVSSSE
jgi:hypothetical protein